MQHTQPDQTTISALVQQAQQSLAGGPHPERARLDAETLLVHVLQRHCPQRNRAWLLAHGDDAVAEDDESRFRELIARRLTGEPIQYILGETEFYGLPFLVTRDVLIPRPETEHLVEKAVELLPKFSKPRILDVGTGSGIIAIALAHEWPSATVTATDVSASALEIARRNARRIGFADRIRFLEGDLLAPVAGEHFHLVVSNPPYVANEDQSELAVEVREYEPYAALFAGSEGLAIYRRLIPAAFAALIPGGFILLEIGHGQRDSVSELLAASGFSNIEFVADLQSIPRVAVAQRT